MPSANPDQTAKALWLADVNLKFQLVFTERFSNGYMIMKSEMQREPISWDAAHVNPFRQVVALSRRLRSKRHLKLLWQKEKLLMVNNFSS